MTDRITLCGTAALNEHLRRKAAKGRPDFEARHDCEIKAEVGDCTHWRKALLG